MKTTSRSTLPALTRVISRKAARGPALLLVLALLLCLAALVAGAAAQVAEAAVTVDGAASVITAASGTTVNVPHTTGTGTDRLLLVGVSANSYNAARTISSVTFTPSGGSATPLTAVGQIENEAGRTAAIYRLLNPPGGQAGTVTVTFSGSVGNGIAAGAVNFAGVDQSTPLDAFASAVGTSTTPTVDVVNDSDAKNERVFDTVFLGAQTIGTLGTGAGQTEHWNATAGRVRGAASSEEATGASTTMSWTVTGGATTRYWAIAAVPINPAPTGPTLTMAVSPSDGGTTSPAVGTHSYPQDQDVAITATPSAGYVFDHWEGDVDDPNSASTTVTMDADKTVTAFFVTKDLTMAVSPSGGGTTSPTVGVHHCVPDQVVDITATPSAGYVFDHWDGAVADPDAASTTVTMTADKTVTAFFVTKDLTMAVSPSGGGTTSPAVGIHHCVPDQVVDITATPSAGYVFDHWEGDVDDPNSASTTVTMDADKTVTAFFVTKDLTMAVSPSGGGTTSPTVGVHHCVPDQVVDITATPSAGYVFDHWDGAVADPDAASTTVTMTADKTVTAYFAFEEYTLAISVVGQGAVIRLPDLPTYHYGDGVLLTAVPAEGYEFAGWSGDLADGVNPQTVTMNGSKTVTATFEQYVPMPLGVDGTPSSGTGAANATSVSFAHTTGTGSDRLMLVGVSWNCGSTNRTISSVTFTPSGGSAINLTEVITQLGYSSSNPRYSAIYRLFNPPKHAAGTVTVTFSGAVTNGSVAGAVNFAGVDQTTPLGTPGGFGSPSNTSTSISVDLSGLSGDELVFDNVFAGASSTSQTLTPGAGQTTLWNVLNYVSSPVTNLIAGASTEQATGSSVTMSWAFSSAAAAITAVPINPLPAAATYDLTVNVVGQGAVARDLDPPYHYGDEVELTATADTGWTFAGWSGGATGTANPTTVTMDADKTVTATFTQDEYDLTVNVVGQGAVARDLDPPYHYGDEVELTATADTGWTFAGWSGGATGTANPTTVTMDADKTVTATFTQDEYDLTVNVVGQGAVARDLDPPYHYGDEVELTATADTGWTFAGWSGGATGTANPTTVTMDADKTVTATFTQDEYDLTVNVVGQGAVARDLDPPYHYGDEVELTATADTGWTFAGWSGGATGTANPTTVTMDADKTVTATFTQDEYDLTVNVVGQGAVARDLDPPYHYGDEVELTATADTGWTFAGWSGGATGTANPTTVTMDADKTVTATFTQDEYDLTVNVVGQGAVARDLDPPYHYGDEVELTATADTGWTFAGWSGGATGTANPTTVTMDADKTVTAHFAENPAVFDSIDVTAPDAPTSVAQGADLTVSWAPNVAVDAPGQFGVWLVKGGVWSLAAVYDADNGSDYTRQVAANVPEGAGYQVYVYYRADSGAAWSVGGLAAGAVEVTASSSFSSIDVTAPDAPTSVAQGADLTVSWAPNVAVDAPGQFGVWLVKGGVWSLAAVYDADNGSDYTRQVAANVPEGAGYQVYVYYRADSGAAWSVGGLAAGAVEVTASSSFSSIDVTAPDAPTSVAQGADLTVSWAPNVAVDAPGQFGVWLVKGGVWSLAAVYDADNGSDYTRQVAANVPEGAGYQVYVYYRADSGAAWSVGGLAAGAVEVTASSSFSSIDVTAPDAPTSVAQGADLTVSWAPNVAVDAPGQFGVWLVKGGVWSLAAVYDADNGSDYTRQVAANVPEGAGYQVYVYYRADSGAAWSVGGLAAGAVEVTASSSFSSIDVTAPDAPTSVAQGADLTVSWAPNVAVDAPGQFGVWLVKGGVWSLAAVYDADNGSDYTRQVAANVPEGAGYQVYVYYRADSGAAWSVGGLAAGAVEVTGP